MRYLNVSTLGYLERLLAMNSDSDEKRTDFADVPSIVRSLVMSGRATR
jgi:hypothetical protein